MGNQVGIYTMSKKSEDVGNCSECLIAALEHMRFTAAHAVDIRMRNFNFFVIFIGIIIAGYTHFPLREASSLMPIFGFVTSIFFFLLDVRGGRLLKRTIIPLNEVESCLWQKAGLQKVPEPHNINVKICSHSFIYRGFFVLIGVASLIISVKSLM